MSLSGQGLTPRLKPLSARKSAILSVLDIGTSKIVCVVAELKPVEEIESLRGRTHVARILGIGHQRSAGLKGGVIVDLEAAEGAIRQAVHAAERMAKVEIQSVIVNLTGGRLSSEHFDAQVNVRRCRRRKRRPSRTRRREQPGSSPGQGRLARSSDRLFARCAEPYR